MDEEKYTSFEQFKDEVKRTNDKFVYQCNSSKYHLKSWSELSKARHRLMNTLENIETMNELITALNDAPSIGFGDNPYAEELSKTVSELRNALIEEREKTIEEFYTQAEDCGNLAYRTGLLDSGSETLSREEQQIFSKFSSYLSGIAKDKETGKHKDVFVSETELHTRGIENNPHLQHMETDKEIDKKFAKENMEGIIERFEESWKDVKIALRNDNLNDEVTRVARKQSNIIGESINTKIILATREAVNMLRHSAHLTADLIEIPSLSHKVLHSIQTDEKAQKAELKRFQKIEEKISKIEELTEKAKTLEEQKSAKYREQTKHTLRKMEYGADALESYAETINNNNKIVEDKNNIENIKAKARNLDRRSFDPMGLAKDAWVKVGETKRKELSKIPPEYLKAKDMVNNSSNLKAYFEKKAKKEEESRHI